MNQKISIRTAAAGDLAALTAIYNHYVATSAATFDLEPLTVESRQTWFDQHPTQGPHRLFVAECENKVVGYGTSSQFKLKAAYSTSVEVSVYIDSGFTGNGVGFLLYETLFKALEHQDIHRAYAGITQPNLASNKLHEKFGFRSVGLYREVGRKFDRYWDVEWFEKAL